MRGRASLVCALFGLAIVLLAGACPRSDRVAKPPPRELALGGVRVERMSAAQVPFGPHLQGRSGDWLLITDSLRAVIGRPKTSGALLDLVIDDWQKDRLTELAPVVILGGEARPLELASIVPVEIDGRAALRMEHREQRLGLTVVSELTAEPKRPWLEWKSRLERGPTANAPELRLGDRVSWQGRAPFAPGIGWVDKAARAKLSWYARAGASLSYAVIFPDRPAEVRFIATLHGPTDQIIVGGPVEHRRRIGIAAGPLSAVATVAWRALGEKLGSVRGDLAPIPEWAKLVARDSAGRPLIEADVGSSGRFDVPLPVGSHRLELVTPGGSDFENVTIEPGKATIARFMVPEPARISYRVTNPLGTLLSARVVVRGVPPTPNPELGPAHLASGAGNVAYTHTGSGVLAVPPGRYRMLVTAGLEYTIQELEVDVGVTTGATLRAELDHVMPTPGWIAADFHLHAEPSGDSDIPLADRVTSLLAEGIEFAAATDHNHVTDYGPAIRTLGASEAIASTSGIEITTRSWGHFNAFPYPLGVGLPPYGDGTPVAIFEHVRSVAPGAVVQINHPRMGEIGYFEVGKLDAQTAVAAREGFSWSFDTIEVVNGFELGSPEIIAKNLGDWFALLDHGRFYTAVGNSDSHTLIVQWTGYPRTYVQTSEPVTPDGVATALKAGRAIVTTGPFIDLRVEQGMLGQRVTARDGSVQIELAVRAPPWIDVRSVELVVNGQKAASFDVPAGVTTVDRLRLTQELRLDRDAWIVAIVRGERDMQQILPGISHRPLAFTNPVFVDADADGNYTPPRASNP